MATVELTDNEINVLTAMLRARARSKKRAAAFKAHPSDRADIEASAMRDYELRKKLIAAKSGERGSVVAPTILPECQDI